MLCFPEFRSRDRQSERRKETLTRLSPQRGLTGANLSRQPKGDQTKQCSANGCVWKTDIHHCPIKLHCGPACSRHHT